MKKWKKYFLFYGNFPWWGLFGGCGFMSGDCGVAVYGGGGLLLWTQSNEKQHVHFHWKWNLLWNFSQFLNEILSYSMPKKKNLFTITWSLFSFLFMKKKTQRETNIFKFKNSKYFKKSRILSNILVFRFNCYYFCFFCQYLVFSFLLFAFLHCITFMIFYDYIYKESLKSNDDIKQNPQLCLNWGLRWKINYKIIL